MENVPTLHLQQLSDHITKTQSCGNQDYSRCRKTILSLFSILCLCILILYELTILFCFLFMQVFGSFKVRVFL